MLQQQAHPVAIKASPCLSMSRFAFCFRTGTYPYPVQYRLHTDEHPAGVGFGGAMLARGLRLPAAAPPITAYHGVRAAEPGRTIDRRNASAERARTATRGSSQASGSRQNIARIRSQLAASGSSTGHTVAEVLPVGKQDFCVLVIPHVVRRIPYPVLKLLNRSVATYPSFAAGSPPLWLHCCSACISLSRFSLECRRIH